MCICQLVGLLRPGQGTPGDGFMHPFHCVGDAFYGVENQLAAAVQGVHRCFHWASSTSILDDDVSGTFRETRHSVQRMTGRA